MKDYSSKVVKLSCIVLLLSLNLSRNFANIKLDTDSLLLISNNKFQYNDTTVFPLNEIHQLIYPITRPLNQNLNLVAGLDGNPFKSPGVNFLLQHEVPHLNFMNQYPKISPEYYSANKPYTKLDYINSGPLLEKYQLIRIKHYQSFGKPLDFGFEATNANSKGSYSNDEARMYNVALKSNFNKGPVKAGFSYHIKNHNLQENGGTSLKEAFLNEQYQNPKIEVPVFLSNASSKTKMNEVLFFINYVVDENEREAKIKFFHEFAYLNFERHFNDNWFNSDYYSRYLLDSSYTVDSTQYFSFKNSVGIKFSYDSKWLSESLVSYTTEFHSSAFRRTNTYYKHQLRIISRLIETEPVNLSVDVRAVFGGFGAGDYHFKEEFSFNERANSTTKIEVGLFQKRHTLDWLYSNFRNPESGKPLNLKPQYQNSVYLNIDISNKKIFIQSELGLLTNHAYFDANTVLKQADQTIAYAQASVNAVLSYKSFFWTSILSGQLSSGAEIIPVPNWMAVSQVLVKTSILRKRLGLQIGADVFVNGGSFIQSYNPILGVFYNEMDIWQPPFPIVDVFVSFDIKNARVSLKYEHLVNLITSRNFFIAGNYPMYPARISLGLSIYFFD